jgi:hypothetical protein
MATKTPQTSVTITKKSASQAAEDKMNAASTSATTAPLTFPKTLMSEWKHIIHFQRYEYSRADAKSDPKEGRVGSLITLPVPVGLQANYSADWQNVDLGLVGNQLITASGEISATMRASKKGSLISSLAEGLQKYSATNLGDKASAFAQAFALDFAGDTKYGQAIARGAGLAVNPYKAVLYSSPNLRTFDFSYKLIPSNLQEANILRDISKEFKLGMHPSFAQGYSDNIFKYPDVWRIEIPSNEYLFKFVTCALVGANFDFHAEGTKSYFRADESIPMSLTMSLNFQEISILTKEDIEAGY